MGMLADTARTMTDHPFFPVQQLLGDIARWGATLASAVDDSWNEEQRKLLEIVQTYADNTAFLETAVPADPKQLLVWKHDALSPLIAITGAAELLVEDFQSRPELLDNAQKIYNASVQARELVIQIADETQRQMSR